MSFITNANMDLFGTGLACYCLVFCVRQALAEIRKDEFLLVH